METKQEKLYSVLMKSGVIFDVMAKYFDWHNAGGGTHEMLEFFDLNGEKIACVMVSEVAAIVYDQAGNCRFRTAK